MKKTKKFLPFLIALLFVVAILVTASKEAIISAETGPGTIPSGEGDISSKEEVIYAKLGTDGTVNDIYAVNILNVIKAGIIKDQGSYTSIKNLTSTEGVDYRNDTLSVAAAAGRFYYQGEMKDKALPWNIRVTYTLDDKPVTAGELAGASGRLKLQITTSENTAVDESFYDNYLLQVTVTLDSASCTNLAAEGAAFANAGTNKLITFTVMPKKQGSLGVQADVTDFTMEGIQISAVPFAMDIELPDTSEFTQDLTQLSDAISQLSNGMADLSGGLKIIKDGAQTLADGSDSYHSGIEALSDSSKDLVDASASIHGALTMISSFLQNALAQNDLSGLSQLPSTLTQLSGGLKELSAGLSDLGTGYSAAYTALAASINQIPDQPLSAEDLQKLMAEHPGDAAIRKLVEVYTSAQTVKATYQKVAPALDAANINLAPMAASIHTIAGSLDQIASGLAGSTEGSDLSGMVAQLTTGITSLEKNYGDFDRGLGDYTGGVSALASSYAGLDNGISGLYDGISGISDGLNQVNEGAKELDGKTKDIPDQISVTVDKLLADYDTSDFQPVSFVSPENQKVSSVQFVLKTEGIEKPEPVETKTDSSAKETIWTRLLNLFR